MPVTAPGLSNPVQMIAGFCEALNAGEVGVARSCFDRNGCFVTPDRTAISGRDAIGGVLAQLVAGGVQVSFECPAALLAGDVALVYGRWRIRSGNGSFAQESVGHLVLRQLESRWKLTVAAPWGWGA